MTAEIALWILSTLGAAIFFGLGWVSKSMRRPAPPAIQPVAPDALAKLESEAQALRVELTNERSRAQQAIDAAEALKRDLHLAREREARVVSLEQALEQARANAADRDEIAAQLDAERRKRSDAQDSAKQLEAAKRRHEQDKAAWEQRTRVEADRLHQQLAELRKAAAQGPAAQKALDGLQKDLAAARKDSEQLQRELDTQRREAERGRKEAAELREARSLIEKQHAEIETLQQKLVSLREQQAAASAATDELTASMAALQALRMDLARANKRIEEADAERDEHRALREEVERSRMDREHAAEIEAETRQLRQRLQAFEARTVEADDLREQNRSLRDRLRELEGFEHDAAQLATVEADLRSARLDNELLQRRLDELGSDADHRLALAQRLEDAESKATEAEVLRRRVEALEARLFAVDVAPQAGVSVEGHPTSALEEGPQCLVRAGAKTSVLADHAGFPLAAAGLAEHHENLAALAGLALEFADRVTSLLPVSTIRSMQIVDEHHMMVHWSLFESRGDRYALSAVGASAPDVEQLNDAISRAQGAVDRAGAVA